MTVGQYALGVIAVVAFAASIFATSIMLRRRFFPSVDGPGSWLATAVVGIGIVTLIGEMLGTVGQFSRWPLVATAVGLTVIVVAVLSKMQGTRSQPRRNDPPRMTLRPGADTLCIIATVGLVAGQSVFACWRTMHGGIIYSDSLQYHLTNAAFFVQSHHTDRIFLDSGGTATPYYPLNDELLHGIGMALLGRDSLSLVIGLGDIVATFLTVFALSRRYGRTFAATATTGVGVMLVILGPSYAPNAYNDWHAAWLLLAAVFFAVDSDTSGGRLSLRQAALVGLAAGLAAGTKLDVLLPAFAVLVAVILLAGRGSRARVGGMYLAAAIIGGGYWFGRDLIRVHNPLPELSFSIGSWHAPGPDLRELKSLDFSVLHYASNAHVMRHYYIPGLHSFLGAAWPAILAIVVIGLVGGLLQSQSTPLRVLAFVGVVTGLAYLVTPTGAAGPPGQPILFAANIRYALPAFVIGLFAFAALSTKPIWHRGCLVLYLLLIASVLVRREGWADGLRVHGAFAAVCAVAAVALLWWGRQRHNSRRAVVAGASIFLVAVIVAGYPLQRFYLNRRYTTGTLPQQVLFKALQPSTPRRIGVVGFPLEYPFFGPTWANTVYYVGRAAPHDTIVDTATCAEWRQALSVGHYGEVVVEPFSGEPEPRQLSWTLSDPAARQVFADSAGAIFMLTGPSTTAGC